MYKDAPQHHLQSDHQQSQLPTNSQDNHTFQTTFTQTSIPSLSIMYSQLFITLSLVAAVIANPIAQGGAPKATPAKSATPSALTIAPLQPSPGAPLGPHLEITPNGSTSAISPLGTAAAGPHGDKLSGPLGTLSVGSSGVSVTPPKAAATPAKGMMGHGM
ncbi:hypothetical protein BT63DRAFT_90751 [Microthyrium microscopicum]|uniref:Uncharacterized protein n=1 Tax=Microthyrium microscopicum TaxID=703497 RepID=A0A6A6TWL7_9PEZI|nr:hypothetical protein BT63DRAFT_90751 [Microthyrium microscopicum]